MSDELRPSDVKKCGICAKPVLHTKLPLCWRVTVERMGFDAHAMARVAGLEMMVGSVAIARAMGADEAIAKPISREQLLVCEDCGTEASMPIAMLGESR